MTRIISALVLSTLLLGSVGLCQYLMTREFRFSLAKDVSGHGEDATHTPAQSGHAYTLVLTPGFDAADDPFALRLDDAETTRLLVRESDRNLLTWRKDLKRGAPLSISNLHFSTKTADVYIEATPGPDDTTRPVPLRVKLYRDDVETDDQTLWSEGNGQKLSASIQLSLKPKLLTLDRGLQEGTQP